MIRYRPNVAAILIREDGRIFVGQRKDTKGAWQFPQGGIDSDESPKKAMFRELREETGVKKKHLKVIEEKSGYRYLFAGERLRWKIYRGQEQTYFLCHFSGSDSDIDIRVKHPEFRSYQWILPEDFDIAWLPIFKRKVYRAVFNDFFGVELKKQEKKKAKVKSK